MQSKFCILHEILSYDKDIANLKNFKKLPYKSKKNILTKSDKNDKIKKYWIEEIKINNLVIK